MVGTLSGSRVRIVTNIPAEPYFVNADPSQFDTALANMAVNARDAMDGQGTLTIMVHPISVIPSIRSHPAVSGDFVAVCIEDTGAGIAPERIEHIFEPFFAKLTRCLLGIQEKSPKNSAFINQKPELCYLC